MIACSDLAYSDLVEEDIYVHRDLFTERIAGAVIGNYSKKNIENLSKILPMGLGGYLPFVNKIE